MDEEPNLCSGQVTAYEQSHTIDLNGTHAPESPTKTYYLRSSVLGGRVISEYDGSDTQATWNRTYVYAGSERVGSISGFGGPSTISIWRATDPLTGDEMLSTPNGGYSGQTLLDPNGVDVGLVDPFPPPGEEDGTCVTFDPNYVDSRPEAARLNPFEGGANCIIDGIEQACGSIGSQAMVQCPNNDCGGYNPRWGFVKFQAYSDGYANYLPDGIRYVGDAFILNSNWGDNGPQRLDLNEVEFGSAGQGAAFNFAGVGGQAKKKKRRRSIKSTQIISGVRGESLVKNGIEFLPIGGSYGSHGEDLIRSTIESLGENERCRRAFEILGLRTVKQALDKGIVIGGSTLLRDASTAGTLGITEGARQAYWEEFRSYSARGATIMQIPGQPNPFSSQGDQRPRIFISFSAFEPGWLKWVIIHEFIHVGGEPGAKSWFGHDLSKYDWHDFLQDSCK